MISKSVAAETGKAKAVVTSIRARLQVADRLQTLDMESEQVFIELKCLTYGHRLTPVAICEQAREKQPGRHQ
ncbi:hypothetical protein ACFORO_20030 [Amycolatopsis halotolerans]|uniref:Uncharacterized protein n=1 Tax=Amycolatopsis halotolerans TaxID=330083 RepID=A0ABV7QLL1_9PSEU